MSWKDDRAVGQLSVPPAFRAVPERFQKMIAVRFFDGGPVQIAETLSEDDEIAGFRVVHLPGHTPGQVGLWRSRDRLALVSDCFYTLDPFTHKVGPPRVPHCAFNHDASEARASIRKLAALDLTTAWRGHAEPLTGDVRAQLERVAETES